jgi:tryptophan synthase alpha subunit
MQFLLKIIYVVDSLLMDMSNGVDKVLLTTPTTPKDRMKAIVEAAEGFVYLVRSFSIVDAPCPVSCFLSFFFPFN